jgi:hypothetical protein
MMMDAIVAAGSNVKLSFYHETEREKRPSASRIKADLDYLKEWYAWHPACAHVDDRPVIFVFNSDGCEVAERWMLASSNEWYVVLKLFPGHRKCAVQPDHWVSIVACTPGRLIRDSLPPHLILTPSKHPAPVWGQR